MGKLSCLEEASPAPDMTCTDMTGTENSIVCSKNNMRKSVAIAFELIALHVGVSCYHTKGLACGRLKGPSSCQAE